MRDTILQVDGQVDVSLLSSDSEEDTDDNFDEDIDAWNLYGEHLCNLFYSRNSSISDAIEQSQDHNIWQRQGVNFKYVLNLYELQNGNFEEKLKTADLEFVCEGRVLTGAELGQEVKGKTVFVRNKESVMGC